MEMQKYLYFRTEAAVTDDDGTGNSAMFPASSFLGAEPTSDTSITVFFKSMKNANSDGDHTVSDSVVLTTATNKAKEAMKAIVDAVVGNTFSKSSFISVIDDVDGTGIATSVITACGAITVDAAHS
tara:strand:+ start:144 stop:521 length:378 start_codon:yes stop_codon:yes gene_type:complete